MAISRKQAKIYALRWMLGNLDNKPDLDTSEFTPYESQKIFDEMDKIADSVAIRLQKLGDNPSIIPWSDESVRRIK